MGLGRGVTPPRSQCLLLGVADPWSHTGRPFILPSGVLVRFQRLGSLKPFLGARWFSNISLVQSTFLGTRLLALDMTEARRCLSYLRCALDLSRRRCPHLQDLCTGGWFQSYAFAELSCMCADRGCKYAWLGCLHFLCAFAVLSCMCADPGCMYTWLGCRYFPYTFAELSCMCADRGCMYA